MAEKLGLGLDRPAKVNAMASMAAAKAEKAIYGAERSMTGVSLDEFARMSRALLK